MRARMRIDHRGLNMDSPDYEWGKTALDALDRVMLPAMMEVAPITIETQARARSETARYAMSVERALWFLVLSALVVVIASDAVQLFEALPDALAAMR
jgi:hypothetical protein